MTSYLFLYVCNFFSGRSAVVTLANSFLNVHSSFCIHGTPFSFFKFVQSSCCLGIQAETRSNSERTLMSSFWRDQSSRCWIRQWSSSSREMENDFGNFNSLDAHRPLCLTSVSKDMKVPLENKNNHPFINQGLSQNGIENFQLDEYCFLIKS